MKRLKTVEWLGLRSMAELQPKGCAKASKPKRSDISLVSASSRYLGMRRHSHTQIQYQFSWSESRRPSPWTEKMVIAMLSSPPWDFHWCCRCRWGSAGLFPHRLRILAAVGPVCARMAYPRCSVRCSAGFSTSDRRIGSRRAQRRQSCDRALCPIRVGIDPKFKKHAIGVGPVRGEQSFLVARRGRSRLWMTWLYSGCVAAKRPNNASRGAAISSRALTAAVRNMLTPSV